VNGDRRACDDFAELVWLAADDDRDALDAAERARLDAHAAQCADCRAKVEQSRQVRERLAQLRGPKAPIGFAQRTLARVERETPASAPISRTRLGWGTLAAAAAVVALATIVVRSWPTRGSAPLAEDVASRPGAPPSVPELRRLDELGSGGDKDKSEKIVDRLELADAPAAGSPAGADAWKDGDAKPLGGAKAPADSKAPEPLSRDGDRDETSRSGALGGKREPGDGADRLEGKLKKVEERRKADDGVAPPTAPGEARAPGDAHDTRETRALLHRLVAATAPSDAGGAPDEKGPTRFGGTSGAADDPKRTKPADAADHDDERERRSKQVGADEPAPVEFLVVRADEAAIARWRAAQSGVESSGGIAVVDVDGPRRADLLRGLTDGGATVDTLDEAPWTERVRAARAQEPLAKNARKSKQALGATAKDGATAHSNEEEKSAPSKRPAAPSSGDSGETAKKGGEPAKPTYRGGVGGRGLAGGGGGGGRGEAKEREAARVRVVIWFEPPSAATPPPAAAPLKPTDGH
jgi:hypothetical protein